MYAHTDSSFLPNNLDHADICQCGLTKTIGGDKCNLCSDELMEWIDQTADQGKLVPQISQLYSSYDKH